MLTSQPTLGGPAEMRPKPSFSSISSRAAASSARSSSFVPSSVCSEGPASPLAPALPPRPRELDPPRPRPRPRKRTRPPNVWPREPAPARPAGPAPAPVCRPIARGSERDVEHAAVESGGRSRRVGSVLEQCWLDVTESERALAAHASESRLRALTRLSVRGASDGFSGRRCGRRRVESRVLTVARLHFRAFKSFDAALRSRASRS